MEHLDYVADCHVEGNLIMQVHHQIEIRASTPESTAVSILPDCFEEGKVNRLRQAFQVHVKSPPVESGWPSHVFGTVDAMATCFGQRLGHQALRRAIPTYPQVNTTDGWNR